MVPEFSSPDLNSTDSTRLSPTDIWHNVVTNHYCLREKKPRKIGSLNVLDKNKLQNSSYFCIVKCVPTVGQKNHKHVQTVEHYARASQPWKVILRKKPTVLQSRMKKKITEKNRGFLMSWIQTIVITVEWLWNPLASFVISLLLAFLDLTVHSIQ